MIVLLNILILNYMKKKTIFTWKWLLFSSHSDNYDFTSDWIFEPVYLSSPVQFVIYQHLPLYFLICCSCSSVAVYFTGTIQRCSCADISNHEPVCDEIWTCFNHDISKKMSYQKKKEEDTDCCKKRDGICLDSWGFGIMFLFDQTESVLEYTCAWPQRRMRAQRAATTRFQRVLKPFTQRCALLLVISLGVWLSCIISNCVIGYQTMCC